MTDLKRDLISLLYYFVERETYEEKEFIKDQENCELKLSLSVSSSNHETKNDKLNLLRIHTKLYQSYQLLDDNVNYDQNSYYIKSQTVSHCTGIASSNSLDDRKIMSVETIVTKDNCKCETVFKTFVTKSDNEKKKKTQRFFTREIAKCQHSPNESGTHNRFSVIFSDEDEEIVTTTVETTINNPTVPGKPKLAKKLSWKKIKSNKITKKFEKQTSVEKKNIENDIKNLQPIKKPKSNLKKIKEFFHKKPRVNNEVKTTPAIDSNINLSKVPFMRSFSTENEEMAKEKPTNIMATINLTKETKSFEIIKDDIPFIDEDDDDEEDDDNDNYFSLNRSKSDSFNDSLINFNFSVSSKDINATIKKIIEKNPCKCNEKLNDFISESLKLVTKDSSLVRKKLDNREPYDKILKHYLNCEVLICQKNLLKYSKHISKSQESLQIPNLMSICKDIDKYFGDNISSTFLPFLEKINKQNQSDLCSCDEKKKKKITIHILRLMNAMKENGDFKNTYNWSTKHFKDCLSNFNSPSINPNVNHLENVIDDLEEPILCDCTNRRFKVLATFLSSVIYQTKNEIDGFDFYSHHFKSCSKKLSSSEYSPSYSFSASPYNENSPVFNDYSPITPIRKSKRKHSVSIDSIKYLDQVFQDIKMENKIECPIETIRYFHKCRSFEYYEKGLDKVLDPNPSIENMRIFFYLTRMIIRHIDDPNCDENQEIKEILQYSETFLYERFSKEIVKQNGLEKFILGIDSLD